MSCLIGIDIGGTNIVCGLLDMEGKLIRKNKLTTEAQKGSEYVVARLAGMINDLLEEEGMDLNAVNAVGIGTPGFVDPVEGISIFAANLNWTNVPLAQMLSKQIHAPVFMNNDVKMYIYGEAMVGAGQGYDHVFGVTIGTGLASASVNKGVLHAGGDNLAGELGHIPMEGVEEDCNCGMKGCLETIVSATGIASQARRAIAEGRKSILKEGYGDVSHITSADVSKAFDLDDQVAVDIMQYTGRLLGKGLSYAVPLFSPEIIIIGGGAAMAGERLLAPMRQELQNRVHPMYWDRLQIRPAKWIDDAGVIGSAVYAKTRLAESQN